MDAIVKIKILGYFKEQLQKIFAPKDLASGKKEGLMSSTDFTKLQGIQEGANNYVHPGSHSADMITESDTRIWVSPTDKRGWETAKSQAQANTTALENMTLAKVNEICEKYHVGSSSTIE